MLMKKILIMLIVFLSCISCVSTRETVIRHETQIGDTILVTEETSKEYQLAYYDPVFEDYLYVYDNMLYYKRWNASIGFYFTLAPYGYWHRYNRIWRDDWYRIHHPGFYRYGYHHPRYNPRYYRRYNHYKTPYRPNYNRRGYTPPRSDIRYNRPNINNRPMTSPRSYSPRMSSPTVPRSTMPRTGGGGVVRQGRR